VTSATICHLLIRVSYIIDTIILALSIVV